MDSVWSCLSSPWHECSFESSTWPVKQRRWHQALLTVDCACVPPKNSRAHLQLTDKAYQLWCPLVRLSFTKTRIEFVWPYSVLTKKAFSFHLPWMQKFTLSFPFPNNRRFRWTAAAFLVFFLAAIATVSATNCSPWFNVEFNRLWLRAILCRSECTPVP